MHLIPLGGKKAAGRQAIIDDRDYDLVSPYRWYCHEKRGIPYAAAAIKRQGRHDGTLLMHQLITGWSLTDHVDHDTLNNQRSNLRPATPGQNAQNRRSIRGTTSRYKGVAWNRRLKKWQAAIKIDGQSKYLGVFPVEEAAALAYNAAAEKAFGQYACLNEVAQ